MKVCAHIHLGPFNNSQMFCDSVGEAISYFKDEIACNDFGTGVEDQCMDVYQSNHDCGCDSMMNFHDYIETRYTIGPRGGIKKENG